MFQDSYSVLQPLTFDGGFENTHGECWKGIVMGVDYYLCDVTKRERFALGRYVTLESEGSAVVAMPTGPEDAERFLNELRPQDTDLEGSKEVVNQLSQWLKGKYYYHLVILNDASEDELLLGLSGGEGFVQLKEWSVFTNDSAYYPVTGPVLEEDVRMDVNLNELVGTNGLLLRLAPALMRAKKAWIQYSESNMEDEELGVKAAVLQWKYDNILNEFQHWLCRQQER